MNAPDFAAHVLRRQDLLRRHMEERGLQFLAVSSLTNVFYLTGFRGSAGVAVLGRDEGVLLVDPRYSLQAREQAQGISVREEKQGVLRAAGEWLKRRAARKVGFDDGHLTHAAWRELRKAAGSRCALRPSGGLVEDLRVVKDGQEIALIRRAASMTSWVFERVKKLVRPGVAEADLAAEIEYRLRRKGAEGVAFESIVASGPRSAFPHAQASSKLLKKDELVIFDLGAILCGYVADMTRTVFLGKPSRRIRGLYHAVLEAQRRATEAVQPGQRAAKVDSIARRTLWRRGLSRYFTHSTGHGLGLDVHEKPRLGRNEKQRLLANAVVTVEPGVYLEGLGGIRIEDTVLVGEQGTEVLTSASKEDWIIT